MLRRPRQELFDGVAEGFINLMGREFIMEIEYSVTSFGTPRSWDDPGSAPDHEVYRIVLREDRYDDVGPAFEATGKLYNQIYNSAHVYDVVSESIERNMQ